LVPHPPRYVATAFIVFVAAFVLGVGTLLTGDPAASRARGSGGHGSAQRSGEDDGFSMTLSSPRDPYLIGRQTIAVHPTLPSGDAIAQVDFFVDGRLVHTGLREPFACEAEFGEEIRRHTIVVRALTRGGRRAKVSFVSRSGDLVGTAARPIVTVPVIVRDAAGHPVDGLSVSDFTLLENGERQRIVHFTSDPAPTSIALAIRAAGPEGEGRAALLRGAGALVEALPAYHALGAVESTVAAVAPARGTGRAGERPRPVGVTFFYSREAFARQLSAASDGAVAAGSAPSGAEGGVEWMGQALSAAASGLNARSGARVLVILAAVPPPAPSPAPEGEEAEAAPEKRPAKPSPEAQALQAALDDLKRSRVVLHAVVLGGDIATLRQVADETGGDFVAAASPEEVEHACRRIAESLLHQYALSYAPENPERKGWRTIELRISRPDLLVGALRGYSTD
jgi:hypothetical protein